MDRTVLPESDKKNSASEQKKRQLVRLPGNPKGFFLLKENA